MTHWFDIALLVVIFLSVATGFTRGFLKESMSVTAWVLAAVLAYVYSVAWSEYLVPYVDSPSLRIILVSLSILIVSIVTGKILSKVMGVLLRFSGLKGLDHMLGIAFGAARGWLIVIMIIMGLSSLHLDQDNWFVESKLVPWAVQSFDEIKRRIPDELVAWWYEDRESGSTQDMQKGSE